MEERVEKILQNTTDYLKKIKCDATIRTLPFKCAVNSCENKFQDFVSHQSASFKFHNFPEDTSQAEKWRLMCKSPAIPTKNLKICSDHFILDDYNRNFKEEFKNSNYKRPLKKGALPRVNPYLTFTEIKTETPVNKSQSTENKVTEVIEDDLNIILQNEINRLNSDIKQLDKNIRVTESSIKRKTLHISHVKQNIELVEEKLKKPQKDILTKVFSNAQISLLKGDKNKVFWSNDDLASAFTLRHMGGKECYLYLKNTLNFPLPSLSCVQAWAGSQF